MTQSMTRYALLCAAWLLALPIPSPALARIAPITTAIEIALVDDHGQEYPIHEGDQGYRGETYRAYVEAVQGRNYAIRVRNHLAERLGVVIAVDGRNIISGEYSNLRSKERMYILGPYQEATYRGWRTGQDDIHRFYFTDAGDAYASAWGDRSALGVVAAAVFRDKDRLQYRLPPRFPGRYSEPNADQADEPASSRQSIPGTGFGEHEYSPATTVRFRAERMPMAKIFYKYEWRTTLCRHGVIECDWRKNRFWPDEEYDHSDSHLGFVPYPPGRIGLEGRK